jgi:predicted nucleic acid-binding protein
MIYLDTNVLVYAIENHPEYGESCKKVLIDIQNKKLSACCSNLVLAELLNVLVKLNRVLEKDNKNKMDIRKSMQAVMSLPIIWLDLNLFVIERASEYDYRIAGIDYVHVASMEINMVGTVISADKEFDKVGMIKRIDPKVYPGHEN